MSKGKEAALQQKREEAMEVLREETAEYEKKRKSNTNSDTKFMRSVMRSGTLSDRIAALTLMVQESPTHGLGPLDQLISIAAKNSRRESELGIDAVKDLFINTLLPDRALHRLDQRPLDHPQLSRQHMLQWAWEDALKKRFGTFLSVLETALKDPLEHFRLKALRSTCDLVAQKPERERQLVSMIVNKLGDPNRKVAGQAVQSLLAILRTHPRMQEALATEVMALCARPNLSLHATYYAITFLNQLILNRKLVPFARSLVKFYLKLFCSEMQTERERETSAAEQPKKKERWRNQKGKKNSHRKKPKKPEKVVAPSQSIDGLRAKLLAALLSGVNRAFAFAFLDEKGNPVGDVAEVLKEETDMLFRVSHQGLVMLRVQALVLLFQVVSSQSSALADRFYRSLYALLISRDFSMARSARAVPLLLSLLLKAMKDDSSMNRVKAFAKRLLQVCLSDSAAFACGGLCIYSDAAKAKKSLRLLTSEPEESRHAATGPRSGTQGKPADAANDAEDFSSDDELAHVRQAEAAAEDGDGEDKPGNGAEPDVGNNDDDSDDSGSNEIDAAGLDDLVSDSSDSSPKPVPAKPTQGGRKSNGSGKGAAPPSDLKVKAKATESTSNHTRPQAQSQPSQPQSQPSALSGGYDPSKREPLYSGAEGSCLWELYPLAHHYHPSVRKFAETCLEGESIQYGGDPLFDFTVINFLDRFVFKNPKKKATAGERGGSLMQPSRGRILRGVLGALGVAEEDEEKHGKGADSEDEEDAFVFGEKVKPAAGDEEEGAETKGEAGASKRYLQYLEEDVPETERFFHKFFKNKASLEAGAGKRRGGEDDASDSDEVPDFALDSEEEALLASSDEDERAEVVLSPFEDSDDEAIEEGAAAAEVEVDGAGSDAESFGESFDMSSEGDAADDVIEDGPGEDDDGAAPWNEDEFDYNDIDSDTGSLLGDMKATGSKASKKVTRKDVEEEEAWLAGLDEEDEDDGFALDGASLSDDAEESEKDSAPAGKGKQKKKAKSAFAFASADDYADAFGDDDRLDRGFGMGYDASLNDASAKNGIEGTRATQKGKNKGGKRPRDNLAPGLSMSEEEADSSGPNRKKFKQGHRGAPGRGGKREGATGGSGKRGGAVGGKRRGMRGGKR